ncbi:MAG: 2-oxoacid:acceptor oxidoreductase family protein [Candidatus Bathyarchaeota archaeon]|nr:2-oxoacid:acceptor oxidoreductase family protein [Candidatus Bathyarchaeota archaeon]
MKQNILISGTGGQGVVSSGSFLSAALFRKGYEVMFGRSYGAEARGGSCRSEIMVSDTDINDLQFETSDILLCLSLPAFKKYQPLAKPGSLIIVDSSVLERVDAVREDVEIIPIPARETALRLGNQIVANMVMLGALAKRSDMVNLEYLKEAVETSMRPSMREINFKALAEGHGSI